MKQPKTKSVQKPLQTERAKQQEIPVSGGFLSNLKWPDRYWLMIIFLSIVGMIIRCINLDYLTLWVDEHVFVLPAREGTPFQVYDPSGYVLPILQYIFFEIFGCTPFVARFVSVLFGVGCIPMVYLVGKKYFSKNVGLFAAVLVTFSLYLVFWSRIARNYAIFAFAFLVLMYYLGDCLGVQKRFVEGKNKILNYFKINLKQIAIFFVVMLFAVQSHSLAIMAGFAIAFYHFVMFFVNLSKKQSVVKKILSVNAVITYGFLLYFLLLFMPWFQGIANQILATEVLGGVIAKVFPTPERILFLWKEDPFSVFKIYLDVFKTDLPWLWWLGFGGLFLGMYRYRKAGLYLFALFAVPLLLMSFIFREPVLPRYVIFLSPLLMLGIAMVFDELIIQIRQRLPNNKRLPKIAIVTCLIALFVLSPYQQSWTMVKTKKHGQVMPPELSRWYFADWQSVLKSAKREILPDDILLATITSYPVFYINTDVANTLLFRQMRYNAKIYAYEPQDVDTVTPNAHSLPALQKLFNENDRVWLFADYYFRNVMTDPLCRDFIIRNTTFRYDLSNQFVKVFLYDKNQPRLHQNYMLDLLSPDSPATQEYTINIPNLSNQQLRILVDAEGMMYDNELCIEINGTVTGFQINNTEGLQMGQRQTLIANVTPASSGLQQGENKFRLFYNQGNMPRNAKIAVYNFQIGF